MKNTFKNKMVQVGEEANTRKEIRNGLQSGELVVITGAYLLNSEYIFKKGVNPMEGMKMWISFLPIPYWTNIDNLVCGMKLIVK